MKEITELDEEEEEKNPETEPKEKDITKSTLVLNPPENNESNNTAQDSKEKGKITIEDLNEIIGVDINNNPENINGENLQYQEKTTRSLSHDEMIDKELEQIKQKNLSKYLMEDNQFKSSSSSESDIEFDINNKNNKKFLIKPKRCQLYQFVGRGRKGGVEHCLRAWHHACHPTD